jgi:chromatin remodeling complex protein RSC6
MPSKNSAPKNPSSKAAAPKAPAPKGASKAASKSASKSAAPKADAAKVTPPVAKVVTEPVAAVPPLQDEFNDLLSKLQQVTSVISSIRTSVRDLEKKANREIKAATKAKAKSRKGNRAPSGFVMPAKISDELANFLGKDQGSEMARTEVTREINAYIRKHNLQDSKNGRIINADASLTKLLKLTKQDELTYFNLQRYMSPHFAKAVKKEAVAPA